MSFNWAEHDARAKQKQEYELEVKDYLVGQQQDQKLRQQREKFNDMQESRKLLGEKDTFSALAVLKLN
jgi:hypothetical protein